MTQLAGTSNTVMKLLYCIDYFCVNPIQQCNFLSFTWLTSGIHCVNLIHINQVKSMYSRKKKIYEFWIGKPQHAHAHTHTPTSWSPGHLLQCCPPQQHSTECWDYVFSYVCSFSSPPFGWTFLNPSVHVQPALLYKEKPYKHSEAQ